MNVLLSSAYWPNLHYFYYVLNSDKLCIDQHSYFEKQSYRNRCRILSANGVLDLSIPVHKSQTKEPLHLVQLSDAKRWRTQHWTAIASAYGKAPYFEYFAEELQSIYQLPCSTLIEFNTAQLNLILKLFRLKKELSFTTQFESGDAYLDVRERIHPKISYQQDVRVSMVLSSPYYQSFSSKFPFEANLSILDALLNKGLDAVSYLDGRTKGV